MLNKPQPKNKGNINIDLKMKAAKLEETLKNFHVDARVVQVTQGPAITRYEIQPNVGVKANSIVRLADDIALNLEAKSIRIEAPIPGKAAVGIEVENDKINMVTLREIIDSNEFKSASSKITFAVGKRHCRQSDRGRSERYAPSADCRFDWFRQECVHQQYHQQYLV